MKTKPTCASVTDFLANIPDEQQRQDAYLLYNLMQEVTSCKGVMWGSSIVGFGQYHYKYKSGRQGDWFLTGFSPRSRVLSLYLMCDIRMAGFDLKELGKHKLGKGCLYVKKLSDINLNVLKKLLSATVLHLSAQYKTD